MKRSNFLLILSISLLVISISLVVDSHQELKEFKEESKGAVEIGSVTLKDYEAIYELDKTYLCNICEEFYCKRNLDGCDFCTERCKWYYPIKELIS